MTNPARHSVLIVDDDDDIRSNMRDILEDLGYETTIAEDGLAAIEALREKSYDVALLDYKMPGMDGATLSQQIKQLSPKTVTIMITAFAGSDGAKQAREAGTWKVLRKPVDIAELAEDISSVLREPLVLVVDDDAEFCANLWEILRERSYRVATAKSEDQAMRLADTESWDVAIVDLRLESGDGRAVIHQLQRTEAKVIVVSGFADEFETVDSLWDCLRKPVDIERLLKAVSSATEPA